MRKLHVTTKFKKDLKRIGKRGRNPDKFRNVIKKLVANEPLDRHNSPHRLSEESVTLMRTGMHSDLFK